MPWILVLAVLLRQSAIPLREPGAARDRWPARAAGIGCYGVGFGLALPFVINDYVLYVYGAPLCLAASVLLVGALYAFFSAAHPVKARFLVARMLLWLLVSHLATSATIGAFVPGLIVSTVAKNEGSSVATLRRLTSAQIRYHESFGVGFALCTGPETASGLRPAGHRVERTLTS